MTRSHARWCALLLLSGLAAGGCATGARTGPFAEVRRMESELRRGVSTKADVERILGASKGRGGTILPGYPHPREVWSYEDVAVKNFKQAGPGLVRGDLHHQLLLVIFDGEVLDGFVWYTVSTDAAARR